ncbi:hypothetical protein HMPREF0262_03128 [Clostridium sp. ATCC 29733]|nr:hypothetical protein HMPREF0262_03128 [Clostridium sp. ATCC 29733]
MILSSSPPWRLRPFSAPSTPPVSGIWRRSSFWGLACCCPPSISSSAPETRTAAKDNHLLMP